MTNSKHEIRNAKQYFAQRAKTIEKIVLKRM